MHGVQTRVRVDEPSLGSMREREKVVLTGERTNILTIAVAGDSELMTVQR